MSTLKNKYISDTFKSLLKLYENTIYTGNTLYNVSDGYGNILPISFTPNTINVDNISITGKVFDNLGLSGKTKQVLSRGVNGLEWSSPNIILSGNLITLDIFVDYTASTQTQIDSKLDTVIFATYTANTPASLGLFSSGVTTGATFRIDSNNNATGLYSTVSGGFSNTAQGNSSTIPGGINNTVISNESVISGGKLNYIDGYPAPWINGASCGNSVIAGGLCNTISGYYVGYNSIGGGYKNTISGPYTPFSTISGGYCNTASCYGSFIGGGGNNKVFGGIIVGGCLNTSSNYSFIGNGTNNISSGNNSFIGSGVLNKISSACSFIGGGNSNTISGNYSNNSFIGGGFTNTITNGCYSSIIGGYTNNIYNAFSSIIGGINNTINSSYGFIGGGQNNTNSGYYSSIINGRGNKLTSTNSSIVGGQSNTVSSIYSFVAGGQNNLTISNNTFILGSNITADTINTTFVENINIRGLIYDSIKNTGFTNSILTTTSTGIRWVSASTIDISTKLNVSDFNAYSAYTLNLINSNYNQFTGFTQSFNGYSANTLNLINSNYNQFTGFTQSFNVYSANTLNLINNKYDKTGGIINGDVSIIGNLTINGSATTVNTVNLVVYDPIIGLALSQSGTTNPTLDSGIITDRGLSGNTAFVWIENNKQYELGYTNNNYNNTNIVINRYGDLKLNTLKPSYIFDINNNTGTTDFIFSTTPNGVVWKSADNIISGTTSITSKLNISDFNSYSANTLNLINVNYSQLTGLTNDFNSFTASTLPNTYFRQSGNTFGTTAILGTNDNQPLNLITSGQSRLFVSNIGNIGLGVISPSSKLTLETNNIGSTQQDSTGLILRNTTQATSGSGAQYSPGLLFVGNGWRQASPAASEKGTWRIYSQNFTGGSSPGGRLSSSLDIDFKVNEEAYTNVLKIARNGDVSSSTGLNFNFMANLNGGSNMVTSNRHYGWNAGSTLFGTTAFLFGPTSLFFQNTQNISTILNQIPFTPTTGSTTYASYDFNGTINQTGGANGISRGIYIRPVLTSAANWRSFEWDNNTGFGLFGSGTASNILLGNTGVGLLTNPLAKLHISGSTSSNPLLVNTSGGTVGLFVGNNAYVGINTNSPTETLDINGNLRLRSNLLDVNNNTGTTDFILSTTPNGVVWKSADNIISGTTSITSKLNISDFNSYTANTLPNTYFRQSGNTFNRPAILGTNDNQPLNLITSGNTRLFINNNGNVGVGTVNPLYRFDVSGTTNVMRVIGSASGSTLPIFTIQGSQGELFSVTDNLTGSLFSVNNISGLPILEVFSNDEIIMGDYLAPALFTTKRTTVTTGTTSIYRFSTLYDGAFVDYTLRNANNARSGQMMAIWSGNTINYSETTTVDIGNTSSINMYFIMSGGTPILTASASTIGWTVKSLIKSI